MQRRESRRVDDPSEEELILDMRDLAKIVRCPGLRWRPRCRVCLRRNASLHRCRAPPPPSQAALLAMAIALVQASSALLDKNGPPLLGRDSIPAAGSTPEEDMPPSELKQWRALQRRLYHDQGLGEAAAEAAALSGADVSGLSEYERGMLEQASGSADGGTGSIMRRATAALVTRGGPHEEDER